MNALIDLLKGIITALEKSEPEGRPRSRTSQVMRVLAMLGVVLLLYQALSWVWESRSAARTYSKVAHELSLGQFEIAKGLLNPDPERFRAERCAEDLVKGFEAYWANDKSLAELSKRKLEKCPSNSLTDQLLVLLDYRLEAPKDSIRFFKDRMRCPRLGGATQRPLCGPREELLPQVRLEVAIQCTSDPTYARSVLLPIVQTPETNCALRSRSYGLLARIAQAEGDWQQALSRATEALNVPCDDLRTRDKISIHTTLVRAYVLAGQMENANSHRRRLGVLGANAEDADVKTRVEIVRAIMDGDADSKALSTQLMQRNLTDCASEPTLKKFPYFCAYSALLLGNLRLTTSGTCDDLAIGSLEEATIAFAKMFAGEYDSELAEAYCLLAICEWKRGERGVARQHLTSAQRVATEATGKPLREFLPEVFRLMPTDLLAEHPPSRFP